VVVVLAVVVLALVVVVVFGFSTGYSWLLDLSVNIEGEVVLRLLWQSGKCA
jgi:hypothetical protein